MASFTDYKGLEDVIVDWIDRDDIRPRVKDFIRFCTIEAARNLRVPTMEQTQIVPVYANGSARVPLNSVELISINWLDYNISESQEFTVVGRTPLNRSSITNYQKNIIGDKPTSFSRVKGNYKIFPLAEATELTNSSGTYSNDIVGYVEIYYYALPPALQDDSSDNWILEIAPDIYFYGGMMHAYRFIRDFEAAQYWEQEFNKAIKELQGWANLDKWSGGPIVVGDTTNGN